MVFPTSVHSEWLGLAGRKEGRRMVSGPAARSTNTPGSAGRGAEPGKQRKWVDFNAEILGKPLEILGNPRKTIGNPRKIIGNPRKTVGKPRKTIGKSG